MSCRRLGLLLLLVPVVVLAGLALALVPGATLVLPLIIVPGLAGLVAFAASMHRAERRRPSTPDGPTEDGRAGDGTAPASAEDRRRALTVAAAAAGAAAAVTLVVAGLVVVAGPASAPLLFLIAAALGGWAVVASVWRREPPRRPGLPTASGPVELAPFPGTPRPLVRVLETLSTPALCAEWRRSLGALETASDPAVRRDLVELRRRYLDELERRDPAALARWLADRPAPAADPAPYFCAPGVVRPPEPPAPPRGRGS